MSNQRWAILQLDLTSFYWNGRGRRQPLPTTRQSESRKTLEQKFIFNIDTLRLHSINKRFSFN